MVDTNFQLNPTEEEKKVIMTMLNRFLIECNKSGRRFRGCNITPSKTAWKLKFKTEVV